MPTINQDTAAEIKFKRIFSFLAIMYNYWKVERSRHRIFTNNREFTYLEEDIFLSSWG